jgi:hypothetical protein
MVPPAARGGTARAGRAAVAAGGAVARLSGLRDAQPLQRAMAPSAPTEIISQPRHGNGGVDDPERACAAAEALAAIQWLFASDEAALTKSDHWTDQRHGSRRPLSLQHDCRGL